MDGVSDGDSRRSPGISPKREGRRGGPDASVPPSVRDGWWIIHQSTSPTRSQCVDLTWGATLVQPDGKRAAQHMAASDRFTLGVLSFLSLGTFAAIFAATQERKVERYRRQGRPLPPGFE